MKINHINSLAKKRSAQNSAVSTKDGSQGVHLSLDQTFRFALQSFQAGNLLLAEQLCRQILQTDPDNAAVNHLSGVIFSRQEGKADLAVHYIKKAIQKNPNNAEFHNNLGIILKDIGRFDEAITCFNNVVSLQPENVEAYNTLGVLLQNTGKIDEAIGCFKNIIAIKPDSAEVHNNLGNAFNNSGRDDEAIESYRRSLALKPDYAMAHFNLGVVFQKIDRTDEAIACYRKTLTLNPDFKKAHMNLGNVLQKLGRLDEAASCQRKALSLDPEYAEAHYNYGLARQEMGRTDEARASYRKTMSLQPGNVEAFWNLSLVEKHTEINEVAHAMEEMYKKENLDDANKIRLGFAFGKIYSDLKEYEKSFEYILEANRLHRKSYEYTVQSDQDLFARIKETFSPAFLALQNDTGNQDTLPVFIIGMPRSGTTLVEQILASHPQVFGADELMVLTDLVNAISPKVSTGNYPECVADLDADMFESMGSDYVDKVRGYAKDADHIIDKMPQNFIYVGLIKKILPNAKIIHCTRNPMDNCLSLFKNYFTIKGSHKYSYDMVELGRYYNLYLDLMAHWERVLPGFMCTLKYDEMVADQENQTRRLLEFCGLPWDEACLSFHKTERRVKTASFMQVRQPMYKDSVELWKQYEKQLEPLRMAISGE